MIYKIGNNDCFVTVEVKLHIYEKEDHTNMTAMELRHYNPKVNAIIEQIHNDLKKLDWEETNEV